MKMRINTTLLPGRLRTGDFLSCESLEGEEILRVNRGMAPDRRASSALTLSYTLKKAIVL